MTEITSRIIKVIRAIPAGRVSCYRDVALAAELPGGARQAAWVLHSLSQKYGLPWHRVVRASGFIAMENYAERELQAEMLRAEGVEVSKTGRVDLRRYDRCR